MRGNWDELPSPPPPCPDCGGERRDVCVVMNGKAAVGCADCGAIYTLEGQVLGRHLDEEDIG